MSDDYYNDYQFKIDYDPQVNKFAFLRDDCGATTPEALSLKDYTDTNDNTIYLNTSTGSDAAAGTKAAPKKTLLDAIDSCTVTKTKIIVLNSTLIVEDLSTMTNEYFEGVYEDTSITVTLTRRTLGYTPADANSIFFDKTGGAGGTGTQADPVLTIAQAIALCDATHQAIVCQDSETYTEPGIEFTGNFLGMYAADGETPTFQPTINGALQITSGMTAGTEVAAYDSISGGGKITDTLFVAVYEGADEDGFFKIYNEDGSIAAAATEFAPGITMGSELITVAAINETHFGITWIESVISARFRIYTSAGIASCSGTTIANGRYPACTGNLTGNLLVVGYNDSADGDKGKFQRFNTAGAKQGSTITFTARALDTGNVYTAMCTLSDDLFAICYKAATNTAYFVLYNAAGVEQVAEKTVDANIGFIACERLSDTRMVIAWSEGATQGIYKIVDETGGDILGDTQFTTVDCVPKIAVISEDLFAIVYIDLDAGNELKYELYDGDGTAIVGTPVNIDTNTISSLFNVCSLVDDSFTVVYRDSTSARIEYAMVPIEFVGLNIASASTINGFIIDGNDETGITRLVRGVGAKATIAYSNLINVIDPANSYSNGWALRSDSEIDIQNNIIADNDWGVHVGGNTVTCNDNLFYRNDGGYGLWVTGTGAAIVIGQCTFFNNDGGIYLQNNGGSESIKNCIFHSNNLYDIIAGTAVGFTYSTYTGSLSGATAGSNVIQANPLFINEGGLVAADIDLQIKIRLLGYPGDSPAYLLSDATTPDRGAGAWDMAYIGSTTTWTSFTVEKPVEIQIDLIPVGETKTERKDGSIESSVEGWMEQYTINFNGLKIADFNNIVLMLVSNNNEIRFYGDPTTNANDYVTCKLTYNPIQASPNGHYELSRTGVSDLEFKFARKYE